MGVGSDSWVVWLQRQLQRSLLPLVIKSRSIFSCSPTDLSCAGRSCKSWRNWSCQIQLDQCQTSQKCLLVLCITYPRLWFSGDWSSTKPLHFQLLCQIMSNSDRPVSTPTYSWWICSNPHDNTHHNNSVCFCHPSILAVNLEVFQVAGGMKSTRSSPSLVPPETWYPSDRLQQTQQQPPRSAGRHWIYSVSITLMLV